MKRIFRFQRKHYILLLTALAIAGLALAYLFVYIPANEQYLNGRRFKALQRTETNIRFKQANTFSLMEPLTSALAKGTAETATTRKYLEQQFSSGQNLVFNQLNVEDRKEQAKGNKSTSRQTVELGPNGGIEFAIYDTGNARTVTLKMGYSATAFFQDLLPAAGFDGFMIGMDTLLVYETFPTGINSAMVDSLLKQKPLAPGASTRTVEVAGNMYQMYIQPFWLGAARKPGFVAGLLSIGNLEAERGQLPTSKVIAVIIAGILLLILLPWIKLFNLGKKDRLTLTDGAMSFLVAMLLVSVVFLAFSHLALKYQKYNDQQGMVTIADSLEKRSEAFLKQIQQRLQNIDGLASSNPALQQNLTLLNSKNGIRPAENMAGILAPDTASLQQLNALLGKDAFQVFWIEQSTGMETMNWTNDSMNAPHANLGGRGYFKKISSGQQSVAWEPIVSRTSGRFRTVMAMPSRMKFQDAPQVICLSFRLVPLMKTVLPEGYAFALTDRHGEVLYHSNGIHNLNEFLPEETDEPNDISAAIEVGKTASLKVSYSGVPMQVFTKPVKLAGESLQLFVFNDQRFTIAKETGAFSFTMLMLVLFFALVSIQLFIVASFSSRRTVLKIFKMETDWIWPRPSSEKVYRFSSWYNVWIFILLSSCYYFFGFITFLFVLMSAVCLITLFINYLYYLHYQALGQRRRRNYKIRNLIPLLALWALVLITATGKLLNENGQLGWFWLFNLVAVIIGLIIAGFFLANLYGYTQPKNGQDDPSDHISIVPSQQFVKSYAAMAVTRLLVTSGLPVFFFYQYAYNYQQSLLTHERHRAFAAALPTPQFDAGKAYQLPENAYLDGLYLSKINVAKKERTDAATTVAANGLQSDILRRFRVYTTPQSDILDALAIFPGHRHDIAFDPPLGTFRKAQGYHTTLQKGDLSFKLSSGLIHFRFPRFFDANAAYIYWILFVACIGLLYWMIIRVIQKIFALKIPGKPMRDSLSESLLLKQGAGDQQSIFHPLTCIVGLPGSGKLQFVKAMTQNAELSDHQVRIIDLFTLDHGLKASDVTEKLVVFNHFEYILTDKKTCEDTLSLVEDFLNHPGKPALVLLSTIHLSGLLDKVDRQYGAAELAFSRSIQDRLTMMLGHFSVIILPIIQDLPESARGDGADFRQFMAEEFGVTMFTKRLQQALHEDARQAKRAILMRRKDQAPGWLSRAAARWEKKKQEQLISTDNSNDQKAGKKGFSQRLRDWFDDTPAEEGDAVIWRLQHVSALFYHHIWHSLSVEERYLVYDLAEEGLVNPANSYHLSMLLQKGLVTRKEEGGQLELMNQSFRNYVLTSVEKSEALQLRETIKAGSSWSDLRTPLMFLVLGVLVIMMISQQKAFSSVVGYMTAIAAIIPTLNALFGLIKPAGGGQSGQSS